MELAVAKLAFSTLSPIINKLGNYVYASYFGGDVTAEEMEYLRDFVLFKIDVVFREAELNPSDKLGPLMDKLQAAAFEAEDLLDLYENKQIKYQVSSSPNRIKKSIPALKGKMAFMLPKSSLRISLEKLLKFADEIEKLYPLIKFRPDMTQANTSTSNPSSPYFGRAKQCNIIIEFLLDESHAGSIKGIKRVPIIAIRGLGGSGKTVTAQHVYNDDRIKNCFDLRMWVHVSRSFDVHRLTKEIIESAKVGKCSQINNLNVLQTILKESVSKRKKFLLVLDDIWCKDRMQWDQLLSPLNEVGWKGSKIIITTRMEEVASILHVEKIIPLEDLKDEDCWSILKHYAFNNHEEIIEDQKLINVGNQIIRNVIYSPLALRIVGSSLRQRSVNEWKKILKGDMLKETRDSVNEMMPLKNFPLCGSLIDLNLENVKSKVEAAKAELDQKRNLNELEFGWSGTSSSTENSNICKEVLEGLEPHSNLEILRVKNYQVVKVANRMVKDNCLPALHILNLSSCKSLIKVHFLPPCLKDLVVENCDELMQLPPVNNTLCTLRLRNCPKLILPSMFDNLTNSSNLQELNLEGFPNLQTLPNLSHCLPSIGSTVLVIEDCPKLTSLGDLDYDTYELSWVLNKCPNLLDNGRSWAVNIRHPSAPLMSCIKSSFKVMDKATHPAVLEVINYEDL